MHSAAFVISASTLTTLRADSADHKLVIFFLFFLCLFVCVEVLRPSQPNGVMSSAVSLPNHTFTGQA